MPFTRHYPRVDLARHSGFSFAGGSPVKDGDSRTPALTWTVGCRHFGAGVPKSDLLGSRRPHTKLSTTSRTSSTPTSPPPTFVSYKYFPTADFKSYPLPQRPLPLSTALLPLPPSSLPSPLPSPLPSSLPSATPPDPRLQTPSHCHSAHCHSAHCHCPLHHYHYHLAHCQVHCRVHCQVYCQVCCHQLRHWIYCHDPLTPWAPDQSIGT